MVLFIVIRTQPPSSNVTKEEPHKDLHHTSSNRIHTTSHPTNNNRINNPRTTIKTKGTINPMEAIKAMKLLVIEWNLEATQDPLQRNPQSKCTIHLEASQTSLFSDTDLSPKG